MKSRIYNLALVLCLVTCLVGMTGCSDKDANEWERLVCEVESVNDGAPLLSAYLDYGADGKPGGDDDFYPLDEIQVDFRARAYNSALTIPEEGAYSWFHITSYDLSWTPGSGFPAEYYGDLTKFNRSGVLCDVVVPVNGEGSVVIMIADRVLKNEEWFDSLEPYFSVTGTDTTVVFPSYSANCQLNFVGHETGSDRQTSVQGGLLVTFVSIVASNN